MDKPATPANFAQLIDLWPEKPGSSVRNFAIDLDVPYVTAQLMRYRNNVHPRHWAKLVEAAKRRRLVGIDMGLLATLAQERALERAS
jgi:hypothetical protein